MARLARGSSLGTCLVTARISPLPPRADPAGRRGPYMNLRHCAAILPGKTRPRRRAHGASKGLRTGARAGHLRVETQRTRAVGRRVLIGPRPRPAEMENGLYVICVPPGTPLVRGGGARLERVKPGKTSASQPSQHTNSKQREAARLRSGYGHGNPMDSAGRVNFLKLPDWPEVRIAVSTVEEHVHPVNGQDQDHIGVTAGEAGRRDLYSTSSSSGTRERLPPCPSQRALACSAPEQSAEA